MKQKRILFPVFACILIVAGCIGWNVLTDYARVLNANWGIFLPFKALCSEVYEKDSGASFHGDGIRYHVFSYKYEDYIDLMFAWGSNNGYSDTIEEWLDEIEVPEAWRPDYERCFCWDTVQNDNDKLIIFWDNDKNQLYIVESMF